MGPKFYKKKTTYSSNTSINIGNAIYLIIVESPSKCGKIESYLGQDYKCIASKGHIRELNGLKNIDIENNFSPTFTIIKEKAQHIKTMHEIISQFKKENIILATDDDREGEGIAWHICEIFNLSVEKTKRILFHEITQKAITDAMKSPTTVNMRLVKAQHARQILDILVGFKISPYLWKHIFSSKSNTLSAGRCQTPALRLIYDNQKERNERGTEKRYKTVGIFTEKKIEFVLDYEFLHEKEVEDFLTKSKNHSHKMTIEKEKESLKSPPKPFNTSRLLQTSSNALHNSPKQTMMLCQSLYQNGFITYMRTDSTKYAPPFLDTACKYICTNFGEKFVGVLDNIKNKDKNNPHEAIRVTDIHVHTIPSKNVKEVSMYKLIWRNTLESCMAHAKYMNTNILIDSPKMIIDNKSKQLYYKHVLEMPVFLGWKQVTIQDMDQSVILGMKMYLQSILHGAIQYSKIASSVVIRNKVAYYNEASLIKKLEDLGIGRPSTFAMIVGTIQERGYVKCLDIEGESYNCNEYTLLFDKTLQKTNETKQFGNEKSKLQIQDLGLLCIEFLTKHFQTMFSYDYTKTMELDLDKIADLDSEVLWYDVCDQCNNEIKLLAKSLAKLPKEKYMLDDDHEVIFTQYGPSIKKTNQDKTVSYFKSKIKKLDMIKLRNGNYSVEDIIELPEPPLGIYQNENLYLKKGIYGYYLEYGENKVSVRDYKKDVATMDFIKAVNIIETEKENKSSAIIRAINSDISIRNGKYGPYVFFKSSTMKKPKFFPLKKCPHEYESCDLDDLTQWITKTHLEGK